MKKKFTTYFSALLLFVFCWISAVNINVDALEKEIIQYNQAGNQKQSQKVLSDLLYAGNLPEEDEVGVLYCLATTYRSVGDVAMCIDYLNKAQVIAQDLPKMHKLRMKLDYEFAFAYFDIKNYPKSRVMMAKIASQNYSVIEPEKQATLVLQEAYLDFIANDFQSAERKYDEAYRMMKTASLCNLPIVLVKMMELYGAEKNIGKVEKLYRESMIISESCGIVKYQTLAAAQMEMVYKANNLIGQAYTVGMKVDSLKKKEKLDDRISEMHVIDKKYLEKQEKEEKKKGSWEKIAAIAVAIFLFIVSIFGYWRGRRLKNDKIKMVEEIEQMREDLEAYSKSPGNNEKFVAFDSKIFDTEKLTERQKELIHLMAGGFSNKEIAEKLFISESTVKYHIKNIYSILELKDRKDFFVKMGNN